MNHCLSVRRPKHAEHMAEQTKRMDVDKMLIEKQGKRSIQINSWPWK